MVVVAFVVLWFRWVFVLVCIVDVWFCGLARVVLLIVLLGVVVCSSFAGVCGVIVLLLVWLIYLVYGFVC